MGPATCQNLRLPTNSLEEAVFLFCCALYATFAGADTWKDPETGVTWAYVVTDGKAVVGTGSSMLWSPSCTLTIPQQVAGLDVVGINNWAFAGKYNANASVATSLKSISIPYGVKTIGDAAFSSPSELQEIVLPDSVTDMGKSVFWRCYDLASVKLSENLNEIGSFVFEECTSLATISIPSKVKALGEQAFYKCAALHTVSIAEDSALVSVGKRAFASCSALEQIVIPSGVTTIGEGAFDSCSKLTVVTLPESLTLSSTESVFSNCSNLQTIISYGAPITLDLKNRPKTLYYTAKYAKEWEDYLATLSPLYQPGRAICMSSKVTVFPVFSGGGTTSLKKETIVWGESVVIEASPNEGFVFLGWSSDVEGIEGFEPTLTFTMPEEPVTLVANFFPKALVMGWIDTAVEAKIDGETLLTKAQAEGKTQEAIDKKVTDGDLLPKEEVPGKVQEAIDEKLANKELVSADAIKEMALDVPMIEVTDGKVKVGIDLQKAVNLSDGTWEKVKGEEASIAEDGTLQVKVPADEKAAFYKFVVPVKQK